MLSPARDRIRRHEACLSEEGCAVEEREEEEKRRGETSTARGHVWVGVMGILSDEVEVAVSAWLANSLCLLVTNGPGLSAVMERIMTAPPFLHPPIPSSDAAILRGWHSLHFLSLCWWVEEEEEEEEMEAVSVQGDILSRSTFQCHYTIPSLF